MNSDAQRRPTGAGDKASEDLPPQQTRPEPVYPRGDNRAGEPLLGVVQNEKRVYVNDIAIPVIEDSLSVRVLLERAGFAPTEYVLRRYAPEKSREKPLGTGQHVKIENNMRLTAVLNQ